MGEKVNNPIQIPVYLDEIEDTLSQIDALQAKAESLTVKLLDELCETDPFKGLELADKVFTRTYPWILRPSGEDVNKVFGIEDAYPNIDYEVLDPNYIERHEEISACAIMESIKCAPTVEGEDVIRVGGYKERSLFLTRKRIASMWLKVLVENRASSFKFDW
mgnify:CR=1 FL=1